jgi:peptidyl-prolyl cis-trans isomerase-like 4
MVGDVPTADTRPPNNTLFICKLNPITTEHDLTLIFSQHGIVCTCDIVRDWKTGESMGYGFVGFDCVAACEQAYFKLNNAIIDDRHIKVDFSQSVAKLWGNRKTIKNDNCSQ